MRTADVGLPLGLLGLPTEPIPSSNQLKEKQTYGKNVTKQMISKLETWKNVESVEKNNCMQYSAVLCQLSNALMFKISDGIALSGVPPR